MNVSVYPDPSDPSKVWVKTALSMPLDADSRMTMTAECPIKKSEFLNVVADQQESRRVAAYLVGRLTTKWKMDLIDALSEGVAEALRRYITTGTPRPTREQ